MIDLYRKERGREREKKKERERIVHRLSLLNVGLRSVRSSESFHLFILDFPFISPLPKRAAEISYPIRILTLAEGVLKHSLI